MEGQPNKLIGMKLAEHTAKTAEELQTDPRWQLIQRVIASTAFSRSSRLSSFLLFVSQRTIEGQTANLNEQEIGVKVFGRSEGYLQSDDNIVRANASRLRQRLEEYFASEGQFETFRVSLPKGGYVPEFATISPQPSPSQVESIIESVPESDESSISSTPNPTASPERDPSLKWKLMTLVALLLLAVVSAVAILGRNDRSSRKVSANTEKTASAQFWASIFDARTPTLVVPADSSLVLYRSMTHRDINLGEYINGEYRVRRTTDLTIPRRPED